MEKLLVFLIQNTQNRDGAAMQANLDELIHAVRAADERFIGIALVQQAAPEARKTRTGARPRDKASV